MAGRAGRSAVEAVMLRNQKQLPALALSWAMGANIFSGQNCYHLTASRFLSSRVVGHEAVSGCSPVPTATVAHPTAHAGGGTKQIYCQWACHQLLSFNPTCLQCLGASSHQWHWGALLQLTMSAFVSFYLPIPPIPISLHIKRHFTTSLHYPAEFIWKGRMGLVDGRENELSSLFALMGYSSSHSQLDMNGT